MSCKCKCLRCGTCGVVVGKNGRSGLHLDRNNDIVIGHLLGEHECRQDDRGRLRLPAEIVHRHADDNGAFVVRKSLDDDCLILSPLSTYKVEAQRVNGLDTLKNRDNRRFKRMFFTTSKDVKLDSNSRIQIPGFLKEKVGITRDVVIAGVGDYYEIWDRVKYRDEVDGYGDMDNLASIVFSEDKEA